MNPLHYLSLKLCKKLTEIGFPETYINYEQLKTDEMILWLVDNKYLTFPTNAK